MTRRTLKDSRLLLLTTISEKGSGLFSRPYLMAKQLELLASELMIVTFGLSLREFGAAAFDIPLGHSPRFGKPLEMLEVSKAIRNIMTDFGPDIICAHQPPNIIAASLANRKIPLVGDFHSLSSRELTAWGMRPAGLVLRLVESICTTIADRLTVASEDVKSVLVKRGVDPNKIAVLPNCVDTNQFYPIGNKPSLRTKLGLPVSAELIAFTAPRSFPTNALAIQHMYKIARLLERMKPNLTLLIFGGGGIVAPVPDNIKYTGFVDDLNSYLNACDLAMAPYPKKAISGGARGKVLEYWSSGLPVVSTREGVRGYGDPAKLPAVVCSDEVDEIAALSPRHLRTIPARKSLLWQADGSLYRTTIGETSSLT